MESRHKMHGKGLRRIIPLNAKRIIEYTFNDSFRIDIVTRSSAIRYVRMRACCLIRHIAFNEIPNVLNLRLMWFKSRRGYAVSVNDTINRFAEVND